jgi:hypothetical protein
MCWGGCARAWLRASTSRPNSKSPTSPNRTPRGKRLCDEDATDASLTGELLGDGVGIHLARGAGTDRLSLWRDHRSTRTGHRSARDDGSAGAVRAASAGRHAEHALSGPRAARLAPVLHEAGRASPHIGADVRFRQRIVNIEGPRIGVARTGINRRQPSRRRAPAPRQNQRDGHDEQRHRERPYGENTSGATVDHFTILRNGRQVPGRKSTAAVGLWPPPPWVPE